MEASQIRRIKHFRVMELRNMALRGAKLEELKARCVQWKVGLQTQRSYIEEVAESLQKVIDRQNRRKTS